jgi:RimJ/RimL family protein N-acetyltransferase
MEPVVLRTERLELSAPTEADIDRIVAWSQDPDVIAFTPVPVPYGRAEGEAFVHATAASGWAEGTRLEFLIRDTTRPGPAVGSVVVFGFGDDAAEIGYLLAPDSRGRGYVTEACARVIDWLFTPAPDGLGLVRIRWSAPAENTASAAVAQRLGFVLEGRLRSALVHRGSRHDDLVAGLLRSDPRDPVVW